MICPRFGMSSATPTWTIVVAFWRCVLFHLCGVFGATQAGTAAAADALGVGCGWARRVLTIATTSLVWAASGTIISSSSRLIGSTDGGWGIVRMTVTTMPMKATMIRTST